jgi:hypothetical protein
MGQIILCACLFIIPIVSEGCVVSVEPWVNRLRAHFEQQTSLPAFLLTRNRCEMAPKRKNASVSQDATSEDPIEATSCADNDTTPVEHTTTRGQGRGRGCGCGRGRGRSKVQLSESGATRQRSTRQSRQTCTSTVDPEDADEIANVLDHHRASEDEESQPSKRARIPSAQVRERSLQEAEGKTHVCLSDARADMFVL